MSENKDNKNKIIGIGAVIIIFLILVIVYLLKNPRNEVNTTGDSKNNNSGITIGEQSNKKDISINNSNNNHNEIVKLNVNETATKENKYELTVLSSNFGKTILPPNTSGYYSYYEAKTDGHQYLEIKYNYKNLGQSNVTADDVVSMTIKYDEKYDYTGFCIIEDEDNDFTYANITSIAPLTTGKLHYLFDVPDEVANSSGSIVATIKCGTDKYEIKLR